MSNIEKLPVWEYKGAVLEKLDRIIQLLEEGADGVDSSACNGNTLNNIPDVATTHSDKSNLRDMDRKVATDGEDDHFSGICPTCHSKCQCQRCREDK